MTIRVTTKAKNAEWRRSDEGRFDKGDIRGQKSCRQDRPTDSGRQGNARAADRSGARPLLTLNIMDFCKQYNERTASQTGMIIPVEITVFEDRTFTFITKTPPASFLIKQALNLESGSKEPNRNKVGKLTNKQLEEIAKVKMPDINANDIEAAKKIVAGTARSMGVEVEA